jgi:uncharacterized protein
MLVFDVRSVAVNAAMVDGSLAPDDDIWMPDDVRPDEAAHVTGRLSGAGNGRFYFTGRIAGTVARECRRCLIPFKVAVEITDAAAIFTEADNEEAGDPDVFPLAEGGKKVDLRPAIREQWLLNVPSFAECRPDCAGICPTCGADLNAGPCSCAPATDSRWTALRALRSQAD